MSKDEKILVLNIATDAKDYHQNYWKNLGDKYKQTLVNLMDYLNPILWLLIILHF